MGTTASARAADLTASKKNALNESGVLARLGATRSSRSESVGEGLFGVVSCSLGFLV